MSNNVSRRSFVKLATDTLWSLPAVTGGVLAMAPRQALAEDSQDDEYEDYESEEDGGTFDNTSGGTTNDVELIALSPTQVGFMVSDMSKKDNPLIPGAHVRITSRYNNQVVEGDTGKDGVVLLDIANLAEQKSTTDGRTQYACNAKVEVTAKGYRDFMTGTFRVEGAQGHYIPTRAISDGKPYPALVTLNEWDVLYYQNLFTRGQDNDTMCNLRVIIKNLKGTEDVTVSLCEQKTKKQLEYAVGGIHGDQLDVTFKRRFLQLGTSEVLPKDVPLCMRFENGGVTYEFPLSMKLEDALVRKPTVVKDLTASPLGTSSTVGFKATFPSNSPLGGKGRDEWTSWIPEFPINVFIDPSGYVQLTLKTPSWGYINDSGKPDENGWKTFPRKSLSDQFKAKSEEIVKLADKTATALVDNHGKISQLNFSSQFKATANLQLVGAGKWDRAKNLLQGDAAIQAVLTMNYAFTENFVMGFIPMFVNFTVLGTATLSAAIGFVAETPTPKKGEELATIVDVVTDLKLYKWDLTNTGISFTLFIWPSLSLGFGVKGLLSASLRGSVKITFFIGVSYRGELDTKTHPLPHLVLSMSAALDIVVEAFLFSNSWNLGTVNKPDWYDNWKGGLKAESMDEALVAESIGAESLEDFYSQMKPVTDAMLASTVEGAPAANAVSGEGIVSAEAAGTAGDEAPLAGISTTFAEEYVEDAAYDEDGTPIPAMRYVWHANSAAKDTPKDEQKAEEPQKEQDPGIAEVDDSNEDVAAPAADGDSAAITEQNASEDTAAAVAETQNAQSLDAAPTGGSSVGAEEPAPDSSADVVAMAAVTGAGSAMAAEGEEPAVQPEAEQDSLEQIAQNGQTSEANVPAAAETTAEGVQAESIEEQGIEAQPEDADRAEMPAGTEDAEAAFFVCPMPAYDLTDNEGWGSGVQAEADAAPGVAGLGKNGGIRPTQDVRFLGNDKQTYGNPRTQVIDFSPTESVALRLGTVQVDGQPRTRLIATVVRSERRATGISQVLDFTIASNSHANDFPRKDLYDYEFAAYAQGAWLHTVLVSGPRSEAAKTGGASSMANEATNLVFTYVAFRYNTEKQPAEHIFVPSSTVPHSVPGIYAVQEYDASKAKKHCISNLQILAAPALPSANQYRSLITFLDRSGATAQEAMSENATVQLGMGEADIDLENRGTMVQFYDPANTLKELGAGLDKTAYELDFWPMVNGYYTFMVRGAKHSDYFTLNYKIEKSPIDDTAYTTRRSFNHVHSGKSEVKAEADSAQATDDARMRMMDWRVTNNQQQFLTSRGGKLVSALVDKLGTKEATLKFEDAGPQEFGISSFGVWGDFIYWPDGRTDDAGYEVDDEGNVAQADGAKMSHIMGARYRNGKFSDPFIMTDIDHYIDTLVSVSGTPTALTAVSSELVDKSKDAGVLWYTAIPFVKTVTATAAAIPEAFVASGQKSTFYITLRNDGNTFLSGCEVAMFEDGKEVADCKAKITFAKEIMIESTHNPKDEKGEFQNVESDYALAPGKSSVYKVEFLIPKDWKGKHKVSFIARDPQVVGGSGVKAEADEDIVEYVVQPGEIPMELISIEATEPDLVVMDDAPVTVEKPASNAKKRSATPRTATPRTADPTSPVLAGGMAAAGAAVLAYERRRAQNEGPKE